MNAKPIPALKEQCSDYFFRLGILPFDQSHQTTALDWGKYVCHGAVLVVNLTGLQRNPQRGKLIKGELHFQSVSLSLVLSPENETNLGTIEASLPLDA
jgi:hypothetical protein